MDTVMLRRVAMHSPRAREALSAFDGNESFCDQAAEVWRKVTGNSAEADKYRLACLAPAVGEPWTEVGRGGRRLPWGWSTNETFTRSPGAPSFAYSAALTFASSIDDLVKSAVEAGASLVSTATSSAKVAVNNAADNVKAALPGVPPATPTVYAQETPGAAVAALASIAAAAKKRQTLIFAGVGVAGAGVLALLYLKKKGGSRSRRGRR